MTESARQTPLAVDGGTPGKKTGRPAALEIRIPRDGWLSEAERKALTPELVAQRVRALQPLIAANAERTEQERRPTPEVWEALRGTGLFYHFVPKRFGGCEFDMESFIDVMLPIGEACGSTCWTTTFSADHNWLASHFPLEAQEEFFKGGQYTIAPGANGPPAKVVREKGGFRINARWRYGSGLMNSNWVFGLGVIEGEGPESTSWFAMPSEEVTALDTWYVDGMAGTGSNDILVQDVFVPEHRRVLWSDMLQGRSPGALIHAHNGMYRLPPVPFLAFMTTIPSVACARGLIKPFAERLTSRTRFGEDSPQFEKSSMQVRIAKADLTAHSAELTLRDVARRMMNAARTGAALSPADNIRLLAQCAQASSLAYEAGALVLRGAGASVHMTSNPIGRLIRDLNVASSHQLHEFDEMAEQHGRMLFGLPPTSKYI